MNRTRVNNLTRFLGLLPYHQSSAWDCFECPSQQIHFLVRGDLLYDLGRFVAVARLLLFVVKRPGPSMYVHIMGKYWQPSSKLIPNMYYSCRSSLSFFPLPRRPTLVISSIAFSPEDVCDDSTDSIQLLQCDLSGGRGFDTKYTRATRSLLRSVSLSKA